MNKLWYLKQLNLFKTLLDEEVEFISNRLVMKNYGKRQVIFEPEDKDKVFILKTGKVEIYKLTEDGKKIIVDTLTPGNVFGDLGNEPSGHFVEALANSFVCVIKKEEFFEMISKNPKVMSILVRELFTKAVESEKQVGALASNNLAEKLKDLLLRLARKYGIRSGERVTIASKFTHEELSEMLGISRPTMTEILGKLERQGVIERKNKIISFDPQSLAMF